MSMSVEECVRQAHMQALLQENASYACAQNAANQYKSMAQAQGYNASQFGQNQLAPWMYPAQGEAENPVLLLL